MGRETIQRWQQGTYSICTDPSVLDLDAVYEFLSGAPWATGLTREAMPRAMQNSLCFSLFEESRQIGLARVISDFVTYAYLCDVYVLEQWRGRGLGSWLVRCVLDHPEIRSLKRVALITHDAQEFYLCLGFQFPTHPDRYLERMLAPAETAAGRPARDRQEVTGQTGGSRPGQPLLRQLSSENSAD